MKAMLTLPSYMDCGYRIAQSYAIETFSICGDQATAQISLQASQFAARADTHAVFDYELAFVLVSQIGIAYGHLVHQQEEKTHEVLMGCFEVQTNRAQQMLSGPLTIRLTCTLQRVRRSPKRPHLIKMVYRFHFDINDQEIAGFTDLYFTFSHSPHQKQESAPASLNRTYAGADIAPLLSPYLSGHIDEDVLDLKQVHTDEDRLHAVYRMSTYYASPTDGGRFHLSGGKAFEMMYRAAILHVQTLSDVSHPKAMYKRTSMHIQFHKPIRDPHHLEIKMQMVQDTSPSWTWHVEVGQGAFLGQLTVADVAA